VDFATLGAGEKFVLRVAAQVTEAHPTLRSSGIVECLEASGDQLGSRQQPELFICPSLLLIEDLVNKGGEGLSRNGARHKACGNGDDRIRCTDAVDASVFPFKTLSELGAQVWLEFARIESGE
jgi:hypothetical protein